MRTKPQQRRWFDGMRVNALDPQDLHYWTKYFGVEQEELFEAIDKVGTSVESVKGYFDLHELLWVANGGRAERRHPQLPG
jgi:hypothetical protein